MNTAAITCPHCGGKTELEIPENKCLTFAKCGECGKLVAAKPPACCVICSYSEAKCPASTIK